MREAAADVWFSSRHIVDDVAVSSLVGRPGRARTAELIEIAEKFIEKRQAALDAQRDVINSLVPLVQAMKDAGESSKQITDEIAMIVGSVI